MVGISFKIKNEYNNFLDKILNFIGCENSIWKIVEEEILKENNLDLFEKSVYSNKEFKFLIKEKVHYVIFANIQLYKNNENNEIIEIKDYESFFTSRCELILFVTDNEFVDIYVKNMKMLEILEKNAIENNFLKITKIESKKEAKKYFSAYND